MFPGCHRKARCCIANLLSINRYFVPSKCCFSRHGHLQIFVYRLVKSAALSKSPAFRKHNPDINHKMRIKRKTVAGDFFRLSCAHSTTREHPQRPSPLRYLYETESVQQLCILCSKVTGQSYSASSYSPVFLQSSARVAFVFWIYKIKLSGMLFNAHRGIAMAVLPFQSPVFIQYDSSLGPWCEDLQRRS